MRWNNLFDDLESQLEHELTSDEVDVQGEEERLRVGRLSLADRVRSALAARDEPVRLILVDGASLTIAVTSLGRDWLTGSTREASASRDCVVPLASVAGISLDEDRALESLAATATPTLAGRLSLAFVFRDLARRRTPLELHLAHGRLHGTIDRVGRDHIDLAVHEPGTPRRSSHVSEVRLVPFRQVLFARL